ncbi:Ytp1 protein [Martiniozyma asiatica (nom. inval.)]|nr:Ytp1 protein [Martiniozyma asiatica]
MAAIGRTQLMLVALLLTIYAADGMQMDLESENAADQLAALQKDSFSRGSHWVISLVMLVIVPSYTAPLAIANRHGLAVILQIISGAYALLEAIILRFNDPTGHENKTSRGTAWFLAIFYVITIFNAGSAYYTLRIYEKLRHSNWRFILAPLSSTTYKILSCLLVVCGFVKSAINIVALLGFCYDDHTGQCNAHGIMGMSFVVYGFVMAMMLMIPWLRVNNGKFSQEFYDSTVITVWGIINTFTEHRPWEPWSHGDYQHTAMGILFWACGMLGMFLSWGRRRSFLPALTLIFTGYAMSQHAQHMIVSTKVHAFFGYVLMIGGLARIMEISFLLDDQDAAPDNKIRGFQYAPSFALMLAGCLFMGATEEQLQLVVDMGADHSSYTMVLISAACVLDLWLLSTLQWYLHLSGISTDGYQKLQEEDIELRNLEPAQEQSEFILDSDTEF